MAILAQLPLTLTESAALQAGIGATVIALHAIFGAVGDQGVLGLMWILLLFGAFTLVAQGIQLHLLLLVHRQATRDTLNVSAQPQRLAATSEGDCRQA
ncbi:hypothetical protein [Sulfurivermis fontis]|uniref:hypothetical protein n=1 Tax=Sulfurivermis fontis TaxID=1972068 RepID=UPI000FDC2D4F|nr:hypothetical protein [Sulfurivermis fontis]